MSDVAIRVENLGKMYRIGGKQERYRTLRDTITEVFTSPFKKTSALLSGQAYAAANLHEEIWALKDVSFEIKHGEVVGIIGRNGAGKSTLLKILSRITEPTTGYVDIYGRVGALLEVGTGFHPELTGRENVYLNGAILGMSRAEIDRKFDEIVDFAGVEKFIDTPVKHYSSGMGLRLGFSVAAHLEPEILVVDEVLAVGDAEFQKKCLGKMSDVAGEGRTVLFVSHNMAAVQKLCHRGILLDKGYLTYDHVAELTIKEYIEHSGNSMTMFFEKNRNRTGNGMFRFSNLRFENPEGQPLVQPRSGDEVVFVIEYEADTTFSLSNVSVAIVISSIYGQRICTFYSDFSGDKFTGMSRSGEFKCYISKFPLAAGQYNVNLWSASENMEVDWIVDATSFNVIEGDFFGTGRVPITKVHGLTLVMHHWKHFKKEENIVP